MPSESEEVKRPSNCFLIYRSSKLPQLAELYQQSRRNSRCLPAKIWPHIATKIIAFAWHAETAGVKTVYKRLARQVEEEHKRLHPDYVYKPKPKKNVVSSSRSLRGFHDTPEDPTDVFRSNLVPGTLASSSGSTHVYPSSVPISRWPELAFPHLNAAQPEAAFDLTTANPHSNLAQMYNVRSTPISRRYQPYPSVPIRRQRLENYVHPIFGVQKNLQMAAQENAGNGQPAALYYDPFSVPDTSFMPGPLYNNSFEMSFMDSLPFQGFGAQDPMYSNDAQFAPEPFAPVAKPSAPAFADVSFPDPGPLLSEMMDVGLENAAANLHVGNLSLVDPNPGLDVPSDAPTMSDPEFFASFMASIDAYDPSASSHPSNPFADASQSDVSSCMSSIPALAGSSSGSSPASPPPSSPTTSEATDFFVPSVDCDSPPFVDRDFLLQSWQ